jgi:hypothetical protein
LSADAAACRPMQPRRPMQPLGRYLGRQALTSPGPSQPKQPSMERPHKLPQLAGGAPFHRCAAALECAAAWRSTAARAAASCSSVVAARACAAASRSHRRPSLCCRQLFLCRRRPSPCCRHVIEQHRIIIIILPLPLASILPLPLAKTSILPPPLPLASILPRAILPRASASASILPLPLAARILPFAYGLALSRDERSH